MHSGALALGTCNIAEGIGIRDCGKQQGSIRDEPYTKTLKHTLVIVRPCCVCAGEECVGRHAGGQGGPHLHAQAGRGWHGSAQDEGAHPRLCACFVGFGRRCFNMKRVLPLTTCLHLSVPSFGVKGAPDQLGVSGMALQRQANTLSFMVLRAPAQCPLASPALHLHVCGQASMTYNAILYTPRMLGAGPEARAASRGGRRARSVRQEALGGRAQRGARARRPRKAAQEEQAGRRGSRRGGVMLCFLMTWGCWCTGVLG